MPGPATVAALYRYPVKGLSAERLDNVQLKPSHGIAFDRAYAIEICEEGREPATAQSKRKLLTLYRYPRLASLYSVFDEETHTLSLSHDTTELVRGDLRSEAGCAAIERVIEDTVGPDAGGRLRIISNPEEGFADTSPPCVHLVNLASLRDLEAAAGAAVDVRRFRANVVIEGLPPWSELDLVGTALRLGRAKAEIVERTERCVITSVEPDSGVRDLGIPKMLRQLAGHADFGVYARIVEGGPLKIGDTVIEE